MRVYGNQKFVVKIGDVTVFNIYIAEYLNDLSAKELSLRHSR